jgi:hypothetical protein
MRRRAAIAALVGLGLGGCGGSSSLSTDDLRAQATELCNLATRQTDRIPAPATPADTAGFLQAGITVIAPELRALRRLNAPQAIASVYATGTRALAQELTALRAALAAVNRGDSAVTTTKALGQKLVPLSVEGNGAWHALEIPACLSR